LKNTKIQTRISSIQMTGGSSLQSNLDQAKTLIKIAAEHGAKLIVLPENFAYFGQREINIISKIEGVFGPARKFLEEQSRELKVWIVGGTIPTMSVDSPDYENPLSSCFVYDDSGHEVACYQKIHLFDAIVGDSIGSYRESTDYSAGHDPVIIDTPVGRLGLAICYDLRFPELFQYLSNHGAEIVAVPSAFTSKTGRAHWNTLLKARAIENLMYVVGSNMGDRYHPVRPTWGGSAIIDPWGEVIDELEEGPGAITANIDLDYLKSLRNNFPVHEHRRFVVHKPSKKN
jgi:nitrilase